MEEEVRRNTIALVAVAALSCNRARTSETNHDPRIGAAASAHMTDAQHAEVGRVLSAALTRHVEHPSASASVAATPSAAPPPPPPPPPLKEAPHGKAKHPTPDVDFDGIADDQTVAPPSSVDSSVVDPFPASADAGRSILCAFGAEASRPTGPDLPIFPGWMETTAALVSDDFCGQYLQPNSPCRPNVRRNDTIGNAAFAWDDGLIRYNFTHLDAFGARYFSSGRDSAQFAHLMVGIMAHEYGHYLDWFAAGSTLLPAVFAANASIRPTSRNRRSEFFADMIAGCVLGWKGLQTEPLEQYLTQYAAAGDADHPPASDRVHAIRVAAEKCATKIPTESYVARLQR